MKTLVYSFLASVFLFSCTEDVLDVPVINDELQSSNEDPALRSVGDPKYEVLGYGYDITSDYLDMISYDDNSSLRRKVIDIESFVEDHKNYNIFENHFVGTTVNRTYFGEDAFSYVKHIIKDSNFDGSVAANVKGTSGTTTEKEGPLISGLFSGTLSAHYATYSSSKHSYSSKYSFARGDVLRKHRQYVIYSTPSELLNYLSLNFQQDLQNSSPDKIVKDYGTHVMLDIIVGGVYSAYYKSAVVETDSYEEKKKSVRAGVSAAFRGIGVNFSANLTNSEIEQLNRRNADWSCIIECRGGTGSGTKTIITAGTTTQEINYGSWESSIEDGRSVVVDLNWDKTYPIYEFISDTQKREAVKQAVERYIANKERVMPKVHPMYRMKGAREYFTFDIATRVISKF